ncbi:MAG: hypothetical protein BroJett003_04730 [Planctomycetota bacterium]|nr:MAG: hypothetical protein BroJett003_04730 [Planctomycetota bacterium]
MAMLYLLIVIGFADELNCSYSDPLKQAMDQRRSFNSARVEWSLSVPGQSEPRYYTSTYAGEDALFVYRGLGLGLRTPEPDRIGQPFAFSEQRVLTAGSQQWVYNEESLAAHVYSDSPRTPSWNPLRIGFDPVFVAETDSPWWRTKDPSEVDVHSVPGGIMVTYRYANGNSVSWVLDASYGFQPTRCFSSVDGRERYHCETEYEEFDGRWTPSRVSYWADGVPTMHVDVPYVEFDRPDHPNKLTPEHLGLVPGIQIIQSGESQPLMWTGAEVVSIEEFRRRWESGLIDGSGIYALIERSKAPNGMCRFPDKQDPDLLLLSEAAKVKREPRLWEEYVRRFISVYRLDSSQSQRAWAHHRECLNSLHEYRRKQDGELSELREREKQLEEGLSGSPAQVAELSSVRARIERIEGFEARVFDERLRPGLDKMPTRAQIDAARKAVESLVRKVD